MRSAAGSRLVAPAGRLAVPRSPSIAHTRRSTLSHRCVGCPFPNTLFLEIISIAVNQADAKFPFGEALAPIGLHASLPILQYVQRGHYDAVVFR